MTFDEMLKKQAAGGKQRIHVKDLQQPTYDCIIAVDPNCSDDPKANKSGVALLNLPSNNLTLASLTFPELIEKFKDLCDDRTLIVIEAGWLNQSNWHLHTADTHRTASKKGRDIGRNHQTGILLYEMAVHYGYHVSLAKPLNKHWKGKDGKITHEELKQQCSCLNNTRSNQDERDAALLALSTATRINDNPRHTLQHILHNG